MIIPDVNILVYAHDAGSPFHRQAKRWWENALDTGLSIGLPWVVVLGFLRLVTHPRIFEEPLTSQEAIAIVDSWFSMPGVIPIDPGPAHWQLFAATLSEVGVGGKLVNDAHVAALARELRAQVATNDGDFGRFSGVALLNPLKG